jgi:hypothetical protein
VFSVALGEQYDVLCAAGARRVRFVPHTYCHVQFADAEATWVPPAPGDGHGVVMVASRAGRVPGISSVPGARARWQLVRLASRRFGRDFHVYGRGWRGPSAAGLVPFVQQTDVIRSSELSVNWDHYPGHAAYASDRLPNSLVAGRPHVTTRHSLFDWLPGEETGLFLAETTAGVIDAAAHVRELPDEVRADLGRAAHAWVRERLSDRHAARYLLSESGGPVVDLPDPWSQIATMGDGRA